MSGAEDEGMLASAEADLLPPMSALEVKQAALYFSLCCARDCRRRMEGLNGGGKIALEYAWEKIAHDEHVRAARAQAFDLRLANGLDDLLIEMLLAEGIEP